MYRFIFLCLLFGCAKPYHAITWSGDTLYYCRFEAKPGYQYIIVRTKPTVIMWQVPNDSKIIWHDISETDVTELNK